MEHQGALPEPNMLPIGEYGEDLQGEESPLHAKWSDRPLLLPPGIHMARRPHEAYSCSIADWPSDPRPTPLTLRVSLTINHEAEASSQSKVGQGRTGEQPLALALACWTIVGPGGPLCFVEEGERRLGESTLGEC